VKKLSAELQKIFRMVIKMFTNKRRNKKIAVVVARLHSQSQGMTRGFAGSSQKFWPQLHGKKFVVRTLVHQQVQLLLPLSG
jgi:hypothetical protein